MSIHVCTNIQTETILSFPWRSIINFFVRKQVYDFSLDGLDFRVTIKGRFHTLTRYVYDAEARYRKEEITIQASGCESRQEARDKIERRLARLKHILHMVEDEDQFLKILNESGAFSLLPKNVQDDCNQ